jgi:host factor-I protein
VSDIQQQNIQADFLGGLKESGAAVSIFLVNGIRLVGQIEAYDQYVVQLKSAAGSQLVYKHAISTVLPQTGTETPAARPKVTIVRSRVSSTTG